MVIDQQVAALAERARDESFENRLFDDPLGALKGEGYEALAADVERELVRIDGLLAQIAGDDGFRSRVEEAPAATLAAWGLPEDAVEPVLAILGAPDEVIERAAGEVELHGKRAQASAAAVTAVLGALAFAQSATAATPEPNPWRYSEPAATAEPNPLKWGSQPEGIRWGSQPEATAKPNPIRWGSQPEGTAEPNAWRWGSQPEAWRYRSQPEAWVRFGSLPERQRGALRFVLNSAKFKF